MERELMGHPLFLAGFTVEQIKECDAVYDEHVVPSGAPLTREGYYGTLIRLRKKNLPQELGLKTLKQVKEPFVGTTRKKNKGVVVGNYRYKK